MNIGLKAEFNFLLTFNVKTNVSLTFSVKTNVDSLVSGCLCGIIFYFRYTLGFSFHVVQLCLVLDDMKV